MQAKTRPLIVALCNCQMSFKRKPNRQKMSRRAFFDDTKNVDSVSYQRPEKKPAFAERKSRENKRQTNVKQTSKYRQINVKVTSKCRQIKANLTTKKH